LLTKCAEVRAVSGTNAASMHVQNVYYMLTNLLEQWAMEM